METGELIKALDDALPDEYVIGAIRSLLQSGANLGIAKITLGGADVDVPVDMDVEMVTKAFFKEYFDVGFGTTYRVQAALGGVTKQEHGILRAGKCFVTAYFDVHRRLITADFHTEMR